MALTTDWLEISQMVPKWFCAAKEERFSYGVQWQWLTTILYGAQCTPIREWKQEQLFHWVAPVERKTRFHLFSFAEAAGETALGGALNQQPGRNQ